MADLPDIVADALARHPAGDLSFEAPDGRTLYLLWAHGRAVDEIVRAWSAS